MTVLAFIVFAAVRVIYRLQFSLAYSRWVVTRIGKVPTWVFWRLYEITGLLARSVSWLRWRILHPVARPFFAISKYVYWRLYEIAGLLARSASWVRWRILHPVARPFFAISKYVYWRIYEIAGLLARSASWLRWRILHPVTRPCFAISKHVYWQSLGPLRRAHHGWNRLYSATLYPMLSPVAAKANLLVAPIVKVLARALKNAARCSAASVAAGHKEDLIAACGPNDVVILPAAEWASIEAMLALVPRLRLDRPLASTLHVRFASTSRLRTTKGSVDVATLGQRLKSGSPFRYIVFHADPEVCDDLSRRLGAVVHPLRISAQGDNDDLLNRFAPTLKSVSETPQVRGASIVVDNFGPFVLVVSALWGRVGSSIIFDSQTKYLIDRGCVVVRVLIEHYPHRGQARRERIATFISENFAKVRPHFFFVAERKGQVRDLIRTTASLEFRDASPIARIGLLLADARPVADSDRLIWAADRCQFAIVNHLPHVGYTQRLTRAPIILETHDIYSTLLNSHGIPGFVPKGPDGIELRAVEERKVWSEVAGCVNLSPSEHQIISGHSRASWLVKPVTPQRIPGRRAWLEVLKSNGLPQRFQMSNEFDVMLWGGWHQGNVAGIKWFLDKVVPLEPSLAAARILVVGRVIQGMPDVLTRHPNAFCVGFADELDDFAVRSKILVVPDLAGSTGISIKAMDVVALGACFASTAAGMRGFDLGDSGYRPSMDAREFARDIAHLLDSPEARRERSRIASRLYELNFSEAAYRTAWDSIVETLVPGLLQRQGYSCATVDATLSRPSFANPVHASTEYQAAMHRDGAPTPRMSIVVPTYNRYDVLPDAIAALLEQRLSATTIEIIVVDNSPNQTVAAEFAKRYEGMPVRYLLEPRPGLSNARNVGTEEACGDIVAFIDDDAIATPIWAEEIVRAFDTFGDRAGVVGGRIVPRWVGERPHWLPDHLLKYLSIVDWGGKLRELPNHQWVAGCNIAYRRSVLRSVGGFSRTLGRIGSGEMLLSSEEVEINERITATGRVTLYAPDALVEHLIDSARLTPSWFHRRAAWQAVSEFIKDPKRTSEYAPVAKERMRLIQHQGKRHVPIGFIAPPKSPGEFQDDVGLTYDIVVAMLSGGTEMGATTTDPGSVFTKILARGRGVAARNPTIGMVFRSIYHLARSR
jgi:GT2 family glycosyltransferase